MSRTEPKPQPAPLAASPDLDKLIDFLREIDQLKSVQRRSLIMDGSRRENSAEHSWHVALMAIVLAPYANEPIDTDRVVRMLLVHDLVEIYAGDTFAYDRAGRKEAAIREQAAAQRLFGLLPAPAQSHMWALWQEFEALATPEARFAKSLDRFMPVLHNYFTQGATWREHDVTLEQVLDLNRVIDTGSSSLWTYVQSLLEKAVEAGYLYDGSTSTNSDTTDATDTDVTDTDATDTDAISAPDNPASRAANRAAGNSPA